VSEGRVVSDEFAAERSRYPMPWGADWYSC
jgi:hypothetical protein